MSLPIIPTLPTAPNSANPETFATLADNFVAALPPFRDGLQAAADYLNSINIVAIGASQFKGKWVELSGTLTAPASVFHIGYIWILIVPSIPVHYLNAPGTAADYWSKVDILSDSAQTVSGQKTFPQGVVANLTGNASTVTNGVYTVGDQTISGVKTFSNNPIVPEPTQAGHAANMAFVQSVASSTTGGITISAGVGLTGGGPLNADRTISMGTPGTINTSTTNLVSTGTHTHALTLPVGSLSVVGILQLSNEIGSTSTTLAATANAVRLAYNSPVTLSRLNTVAAGNTLQMADNAAVSDVNYDSNNATVYRTHGGTFSFVQGGSVRVNFSHRRIAGTVTAIVYRARGGTSTAMGSWATSSTSWTLRSIDVAIEKGDKIFIQQNRRVRVTPFNYGGDGGYTSYSNITTGETVNRQILTDGSEIWPL